MENINSKSSICYKKSLCFKEGRTDKNTLKRKNPKRIVGQIRSSSNTFLDLFVSVTPIHTINCILNL